MPVLGRQTTRHVVELELYGTPLTFSLHGRRLALGDHASIDYYWMDGSEFRKKKFSANFRNCMLHARAVTHEMGWQDDTEQMAHLVWALCYPQVSREKSLQRIYRDAFLRPPLRRHAPNRTEHDELPTSKNDDIRSCIRSCDRFEVKQLLDDALGRFEPPSRMLPLLQQACQHWLGQGIALFRDRQVERFLEEVELWLRRYRRQGGNIWVRHFVNMFSYEAKTCFYRCYANAWIDIIPWLKENRGLDETSERFMRVWHNQNQPVEIPHGRTLSGVIYPTQASRLILHPGQHSHSESHAITWQTDQIGPTHVPDVFAGQVLSLHPLSSVIMKDPAMLSIAGRFFGTDAYARFFVNGERNCAEYWDLVGVILTAAHLYRLALDRQNQRSANPRTAFEMDGATIDGLSTQQFINDFAAARSIRCPTCHGPGTFVAHRLITDSQVDFQFRCPDCETDFHEPVEMGDLAQWLIEP